MGIRVPILFALAVALLAQAALAASPKSIFDDDWKPPKPTENPRPAPIKPDVPAAVDPTAARPATRPDDPASTAAEPQPTASPAAAAARKPVPGAAEQAAV